MNEAFTDLAIWNKVFLQYLQWDIDFMTLNNLLQRNYAKITIVCLFVIYLFVWAGWSFGSYSAEVDIPLTFH